MSYAIAYLLALVMFVAVDIVWLSTVGGQLYRQALGDILAPSLRLAPAIAFYLMYPIGLVLFGIAPGLKAGTPMPALIYGGLFGLFTYATYELTNFATLRNWTLQITIVDMAYGVVVSGLVAYAAAALTPYLTAATMGGR